MSPKPLEQMSLEEKKREATELARRLTANRYVPYPPTDKQGRFLLDFRLEAMFGGAAGGGKSDALLMGALQFVDVPGFAALILRKTMVDLLLPGALLDRSKLWLLNSDARKSGSTWHFPSGARIQFGYIAFEKQKYRYQSSEFQYIAFDELTQFTESQYRYMFSRLRRPKLLPTDSEEQRSKKRALSKVPLRMRSATNPGGVGHEWVKRRFIDSERDPRRKFYPAKLSDNPHVDEEEYTAALSMLDPVTRQQLLDGDWSVRTSGGYFARTWFTTRIVDDPPGRVVRRVRYWDLASTEQDPLRGNDPDWTAGCRMSILDSGELVVEDMRRFRKNPGGVEREVEAAAASDPHGTEVYFEQEGGASGKAIISHYRRRVLQGVVVKGHRPTGNKVTRAIPLSSRASAGDVWMLRGSWHSDFFDEAEAFPDGAHDDQIDAASGAYAVLVGKSRTKIHVPAGSQSAVTPGQSALTQGRIQR